MLPRRILGSMTIRVQSHSCLMQGFRVRARPQITALVGLACLLVLVGMSTASLPAAAQPAGVSSCPVLELANPSPGDVVNTGAYVVQGLAFDPITLSSSDVSRIEFYLGTQDTGGTLLGTAVPGAPPASGPNTFQTTLKIPDVSRDDTFNAIAFSTLSGATTIIQRQIHVGATTTSSGTVHPTPSPVPLSITIKRGCPVAAPGPQLVATTTVPVISITQGQGPELVVGNPSAYDTLSRGPLVVSGLAFDRASTNGAGIDHVEFFLGDRDAGGVSLGGTTVPGQANPALPRVYNTVVHIPTNANGQHDFVTYARSSLTGLETKVSVPVFIGAPPTRTPGS
jgi:hypothetical protein